MLKEVLWSEDRSYRTGSKTQPIQFYLDGLCNSNKFDLLLGYFSSAAINVLSLGFASFLYNGGTLRMAINNVLSQEDKDAIKEGRNGNIENNLIDLSDIKGLQNSLDEYGKHFFDCLAWLISNNKIQIKIIKPKFGKGIAHYKSGAFSDSTNTVGFKASCNFTAFGLMENLEELDAFLSWENSRSSKMITRQNNDFENIFSGKSDVVDYLEIDDVIIAIKNEFGNNSLNELLINEKDLLEKKGQILEKKGIKKSFEKINSKIEEIIKMPRFPFSSEPRDYQMQAYSNWVNNNYQGIFAMATGTGKTITALNCVLEQYKEIGNYKVIILVPTISLAEQWEKECLEFNFQNVIKINSASNWQSDVAFLNTAKYFIKTSFIIISTYASFHRPKFQEFFQGLDTETILIGDEVHNMGAPSILRLLPNIHLKKRIGLSATPKRIYDEDGGSGLESFFNDKEPYTFNFSMEEAINKDILCRYLYYPHIIELTDQEYQEYQRISRLLAKFFDVKEGRYKNDPAVEKWLLERKRIIHKAVNKKPVFEAILKTEYDKKQHLKYTLVYVPEGIEPNYSEVDHSDEDIEDKSLIDTYTKIVSRINRRVTVKQFTSNTSDRDAIIRSFKTGDTQVLTSMKCLDEGIDVPRSELAIFCASTGNPRQFIQRRGRVLRTHKDKSYAIIHDLVVVPKSREQEETYTMERNLIQKELERVIDFSKLADNKIDTFNALKSVLDMYDLSLYDSEN